MNDKFKGFIEGSGWSFLGGAIPGFFTGLFLFFNNPTVGEFAVIANLIKVFMAFALAISTGMGGIVVQYTHKKIKAIIRKRKIKKHAIKRQEKAANRRTA